jgi:hypothetical protein
MKVISLRKEKGDVCNALVLGEQVLLYVSTKISKMLCLNCYAKKKKKFVDLYQHHLENIFKLVIVIKFIWKVMTLENLYGLFSLVVWETIKIYTQFMGFTIFLPIKL